MVTLAEVARQAGVSPSTVSYVLSRKRSISDDTRRKVEAAIESLGYHPHAGARALASNRSNIVALMIPLRSDMYVPVIMEIAMAVTTEAREFGQDVLLLTKDEGTAGVRVVAERLDGRLDLLPGLLRDRALARQHVGHCRGRDARPAGDFGQGHHAVLFAVLVGPGSLRDSPPRGLVPWCLSWRLSWRRLAAPCPL